MTGEGALSAKGRLSVEHSPVTCVRVHVCVCARPHVCVRVPVCVRVQVKVRLGYAGGSSLSASPESFARPPVRLQWELAQVLGPTRAGVVVPGS